MEFDPAEVLTEVEADEFGPLTPEERQKLLDLIGGDPVRTMHLAGRLAQVALLAVGITESDLSLGMSITAETDRQLRQRKGSAASGAVVAVSLLLSLGQGPGGTRH